MNPLFSRSMVDFQTHELIVDRLFYRSAITNEIRSRLVKENGAKVQRNDEARSFKIWLNEGIKWHDGQAFGAKDVCFTIDAMLNTRTPSQIAKQYRESIQSCKTNKDNSVEIIFRKVYHNPRDRLGFSVLPAHAFASTAVSPDTDFSVRPIGTGSMKGSKGRREVLFRKVTNTHHNARIGALSMAEGGDPYVQVRTLVNSGVQGLISVAPPLRPEVAASDDVALKSYDLRSWWFIALNTKKGALTNQKIRQALDVSIDRSELRELTIGVDPDDPNPPCEFVSGPFVQSSAYYNRSIKIVERSDRAKARQLMIAAGAKQQAGRWVYQGRPVSLRLGMNAPLDAEAKDLLNQIGNQLQASGFDRQVYKVTSDDWNRKAVTGQLGEYDLLIGKWSFGLVEDVNALFKTRKGGEGALNIFNYSNQTVDRILSQYDASRTDTQAQDAYHDLHKTLATDLPYIFLWKLDTKSAWRNEIRNSVITPYYYFTEFDGWKFDG